MNIIEQLRAERLRCGLSLSALAKEAGVSCIALGSWERSADPHAKASGVRNPTLAKVEQWAAAFGLKPVLVPATDALDWPALHGALMTAQQLVEHAPRMAELVEALRRAARQEAAGSTLAEDIERWAAEMRDGASA